MIIKVEENKN